METALVMIALIAFVAYRHWLRHQRRVLVHRERMTALEKGIELPSMVEEVQQSGLGMRRYLLLGGLIWIALGIGLAIAMTVLLNSNLPNVGPLPRSLPAVGLIPALIGLAHLIVFWVEVRAGKR